MLNKVIIMGRITKDLDLKQSLGGMALLSFSVAVNRKYVKEGEERQADFITCKAFNKTAENIAKFFGKGKLIAIDGHIQTGSYEKDGNRVYTTDVIVDGFHFTGEKKSDNQEPIEISGTDELPF